jgi:hypothetical protein
MTYFLALRPITLGRGVEYVFYDRFYIFHPCPLIRQLPQQAENYGKAISQLFIEYVFEREQRRL